MDYLPSDFLNRMKEELGNEVGEFLDSFEHEEYKALRVNTLKISVEEFLALNPWGISCEDKVSWCRDGLYYSAEGDDILPPGKHPFHGSGLYYIQEPSAMAPVEYLDIVPGNTVLDLCAAPGGKSTEIASRLEGKGLLVANEPVPSRAAILSENIERMGIANGVVISEEPWDISERFEEMFDRILVDAPCSGEGMFRKNSEAIREWSLNNVTMCAKRQQDILTEAFKMLKPGGRLVYSTCTFSKEENEDNVDFVVNNFPNVKHIESKRLWPHKVKGEGHFLAVFEKKSADESKEDLNAKRNRKEGKNKKNYSLQADRKSLADWFEFRDSFFSKEGLERLYINGENYLLFGEELYLIPDKIPELKNIKVLRSGLHLGTLKKSRFEPSFSLALFMKPSDCRNNISLSLDETVRYQKGETIQKSGNKGWNLLNVEGHSVGFGKVTGDIVKNHYPKGLRK